MLLGIKWYHFISNDEVRHQTNQPLLKEIIQARRLTLFGHIIQMDDNIDAKQKTVHNDLDSHFAAFCVLEKSTGTTTDDPNEDGAQRPRFPQAVMDRRSRPGPEPTTLEAVGDQWRYCTRGASQR